KDRTADAAGGRLRPPALRLRLSGPSPAALRTECWRPEPALGRGYTDRSGQQALRAHDVHPVSGPDHPRGVWRVLVLGTADSPPRIWTRSCIPAKRWPPREIGVGLAKLRHRNETLLSKVLVEGERFPHAFSSHDLETGPVDQRHLHRACQE